VRIFRVVDVSSVNDNPAGSTARKGKFSESEIIQLDAALENYQMASHLPTHNPRISQTDVLQVNGLTDAEMCRMINHKGQKKEYSSFWKQMCKFHYLCSSYVYVLIYIR
jgi:hypothetical protein